MRIAHKLLFVLVIGSAIASSARAEYFQVTYPASTAPGELPMGVVYTVWIPDGVAQLRAVIVHQHGCGVGACKGGATAAHDLHWQALAKKWNAALVGPSYQQDEKQNCRLWCDPRNGSAKAFLNGLHDLATKSKHPELETAPWCLWGHSGGGFWASIMQTLYPQRIVSLWFRSGTAFATWEKGEIPAPEITPAVLAIPAMCNPGAKERGDKRFGGAWTGNLAMFQAYRAKGAPIGFAPDPRTSHQCGDSRYLAIPFFDACLALRLPAPGEPIDRLKAIDVNAGWLADPSGDQAEPAHRYRGKADQAVWLPSETVARVWREYVSTGETSDTTPPPAPKALSARRNADGAVELTWQAEADFESGLQQFVVQRDSQVIGRIPEKPVGKFGRPLFQSMSYHDTPEEPLPAMRFVDTQSPGGKPRYQVIAINAAGLSSPPSSPVTP